MLDVLRDLGPLFLIWTLVFWVFFVMARMMRAAPCTHKVRRVIHQGFGKRYLCSGCRAEWEEIK